MHSSDAQANNLPDWMKMYWVTCAPFAAALAFRIGWEKTVWTWTRGPQMIGFSLWHIHPLFAIVGLLSFWCLCLWLLIALAFLILRRRRLILREVAMLMTTGMIVLLMTLPDNFFATVK